MDARRKKSLKPTQTEKEVVFKIFDFCIHSVISRDELIKEVEKLKNSHDT